MLELKQEDLFDSKCEHCNGTGIIQDSTPTNFPNVGKRAGGMGDNCPECEGLGGKVTPAGEVIRDFIVYLNRIGQI